MRPFKLIPSEPFSFYFLFCYLLTRHFFQDAVHHYDEYGLANIQNEPPEILEIHEEEIAFVQSWLKDWNAEHGVTDD